MLEVNGMNCIIYKKTSQLLQEKQLMFICLLKLIGIEYSQIFLPYDLKINGVIL